MNYGGLVLEDTTPSREVTRLDRLTVALEEVKEEEKKDDIDVNQENREIRYWAAFNMPAVLLVLGNSQWVNLSPMYTRLCCDPNPDTRRSLSSSLHEIAKILGD